MTTDPLCPQQHTHPKHDPNRCIFCEYGGAAREDERGKWEPMVQALTDELLIKAQPDVSMGAQYLAGRSAGLDAATEAVAALPLGIGSAAWENGWNMSRETALDAIAALR